MAEYTREQLWGLYEKLPPELKEAVFSAENADHIFDICERNEVGDKVSEIAARAGRVLLGVLPPEDFQKALEKEVGLKKDAASAITREINRFVFWPVKSNITQLHEVTAGVREKPSTPGIEIAESARRPTETKEKPQRKTEDTYREPVEG